MAKKLVKKNTEDQGKFKSKPELKDYFNNNWLNYAILFIVWLLIFSPLLSGSAWLHDDFPYVYFPGKFFAAVSLADGVIPFWNPYSFGGMPFFADPQIALFYPFNYLYKFFVSGGSLSPVLVQSFLVFHYYMFSVFCYLLAKELNFKNFPSLIFSLMFTYSSFMIIHMIHMNIIETVVWLPLLFLFLLKFIIQKRIVYVILAGIVMAVSILAGYPQVYFFNSIFLSLFVLYFIYLAYRSKDLSTVRLLFFGLIIFFVISICISSVQLLPTYTFTENSSRSELGYEFAKQGSVHPLDLLTLLVPKIFGTFNWNESAGELSYWSVKSQGGHQEGRYMYTVSTIYLTLLPLFILIPVARFALKKKEMRLPMILILSFSLFTIMFAFGGHFFVHELFFSFVPLFDKFRNPGHITYLFTFCILIVSAFGLNLIVSNKNEMKQYFSTMYFLAAGLIVIAIFLLTIMGVFKSGTLTSNPQIYAWITKQVNIFFFLSAGYLVILYLYFSEKIKMPVFQILLLAVVIIDVFLFSHNQNNGNQDPKLMYAQNAALINQVKEDQADEYFRVKMREGSNILFQRYQGPIDKIFLLEGINVLNLSRIYPVNKEGSTQLTDLMNVKYKIKTDEKTKNNSLEVNDTYLPRARMFYDIKVIPEENALKDYMKSNEYDYRKTLVLEKNPEGINLPALDTGRKINSNVRISEYGLNNIKIDAETDENGFLFLSEVFYPDWKALVDGKETEIFRTDYSLRSVYLEKGKHTVEFIYDSKGYDLGSKLSLGALSVSVVLLGLLFYRKKKAGG